MKTLYSESEGEDEPQDVAFAEPVESTLTEPSGEKDGAFGSTAVEEEVVVEDVEWGFLFLFLFYLFLLLLFEQYMCRRVYENLLVRLDERLFIVCKHWQNLVK